MYGVEAAADDYGFDVLILNGGRDAERSGGPSKPTCSSKSKR